MSQIDAYDEVIDCDRRQFVFYFDGAYHLGAIVATVDKYQITDSGSTPAIRVPTPPTRMLEMLKHFGLEGEPLHTYLQMTCS